MTSSRRRADKPARVVGFRLSKAARQDLIEIHLHGEDAFGEPQADRYLVDLYATFAFLAENPRAARTRAEYDPPVRVYPHRPHIVVYQEDQHGILIIRVRHGREDWYASPHG
jgi:toxin ParE1/3/4